MCDERTYRQAMEYLQRTGRLTRREFGAVSAGVSLAILLPPPANAQEVMGADVEVTTPDGIADCYFVYPTSGTHPGVVMWPDIMGLRPAYKEMARRLAQSGYAVLVINPYYRETRAPVIPEGATYAQEETRTTVRAFARNLSPETHVTDARAFVAYLDEQRVVDPVRKIGTVGYCMGGPIVMRMAAAVPDRVGAGASFHGSGQVTDEPTSPHLLVQDMQARFLFGIAENDDADFPQEKVILRETFEAAGLPAEIEVYDGTLHGWCPPDSHVYSEAQAERAWMRLLALFETALA